MVKEKLDLKGGSFGEPFREMLKEKWTRDQHNNEKIKILIPKDK